LDVVGAIHRQATSRAFEGRSEEECVMLSLTRWSFLALAPDLQRVQAGRIGFWTKRDSLSMFRQIIVGPERVSRR
jgi:hypothetical protein